MFNFIKARIHVGKNSGAEKSVNNVSSSNQYSSLTLISCLRLFPAVPVITITEDSGVGFRQEEVRDGHGAERNLVRENPPALKHSGSDCNLNVSAFGFLHGFCSDTTATVRASYSDNRGASLPEGFIANRANNHRHIVLPASSAFTLPVYVSARFRAKSYLAGRLERGERLATFFAHTGRLSCTTACCTQFSQMLRAKFSTLKRAGYSGLMLCGFNNVRLAMDSLFSFDKSSAAMVSALVWFMRHIDLVSNGCLTGKCYHE